MTESSKILWDLYCDHCGNKQNFTITIKELEEETITGEDVIVKRHLCKDCFLKKIGVKE